MRNHVGFAFPCNKESFIFADKCNYRQTSKKQNKTKQNNTKKPHEERTTKETQKAIKRQKTANKIQMQ